MNQPLSPIVCLLSLLALIITPLSTAAAPPKTSQHASFKAQDFERMAVIVKPIENQPRHFNMSRRKETQTSLERLVEQNFMRVLIKSGFTLVSRTDLDAAMVEKGLDQARMTDEKYSEEAAKLLHVSALMVVSVDAFSVKQLQGSVPTINGHTSYGNTRNYYQLTASIAARLIKIDDNMVMWTGDLSLGQNLENEDQDGIVLGSMAESIAAAFPPFVAKAK